MCGKQSVLGAALRPSNTKERITAVGQIARCLEVLAEEQKRRVAKLWKFILQLLSARSMCLGNNITPQTLTTAVVETSQLFDSFLTGLLVVLLYP